MPGGAPREVARISKPSLAPSEECEDEIDEPVLIRLASELRRSYHLWMCAATKSPFWRRMVLAVWRASLVVMAFLWLHPVSYRSSRAAIVGLIVFLWGGSLVLWWRLKPVRIVALSV